MISLNQIVLGFVTASILGLSGAVWVQTKRVSTLTEKITTLKGELADCKAGQRIAGEEKLREDAIADKPFDELLDDDWVLPEDATGE